MEILGTVFTFSAPLADRFPVWLQKSCPGSRSGNLTSPLVELLQKTSQYFPQKSNHLRASKEVWIYLGNSKAFCGNCKMWICDNLSSNTLCGKCWSNFAEVFTQASCRHYKYVKTCLWKMKFFNTEKNKQQKGKFQPDSTQLNYKYVKTCLWRMNIWILRKTKKKKAKFQF